jgi:hypothetical protein
MPYNTLNLGLVAIALFTPLAWCIYCYQSGCLDLKPGTDLASKEGPVKAKVQRGN